MARALAGLLFLGLGAMLGACGAQDDGASGVTSCGGNTPIECRSPEGKLQGCCAQAHPVCSLDGLSCGDFGSGGSSGSGAAGASGGSSGAAGHAGGNGGSSAGGGGGTGGSGGSGGAGAAGGAAGSAGTGGTGGTGATCNDPDEPNDSENAAKNLGAISDCDTDATSVAGVLDGKTDVDWFTYYGNDTSCIVDPFASTSANVRLCLFADCPSAQVSCSAGSIAASPLGRPGCCVLGGGQLPLSLNCNGINDSAAMYLRIDQPAQNQCVAYTVDYHF